MMVESLLSLKGTSAYNEDIIGFKDNYAWVLDGATDLFHLKIFSDVNDTQSLVKQVNLEIYKNIDDELSLSQIVENAMSSVSKKFLANEEIPYYKLPTFTILLVRERKGTLEYFILGDSYVVIEKKEVHTDDRLSKFDLENRKKLKNISEKEERVRILQETRKLMNRPDGYYIGSIDGKGIEKAILGVAKVNKGDRVALFTDGFLEYFDGEESLKDFEFSSESIEKVVHSLFHKKEGHDLGRFKKRDDMSIVTFLVS